MKVVVKLLLLCLCAACTTSPPPQETITPEPFTVTRTPREAVAAYERVRKRVEPIAERTCRERNPRAPSRYCDFRVVIDTSKTRQPNAFQTIGKDGRPIIAFNIPMLATIKNDHEIAFIMGHEAAHQINNHLAITNANANLGAVLLGGIVSGLGGSQTAVSQAQNLGGAVAARAYSQDHELEADILGARIAHQAGYDPLVGAQSFARFTGGGGFLSTHPPSSQRLAAVRETMDRIKGR